MDKIKVIIADDSDFVREGMRILRCLAVHQMEKKQ